MHIPKNVPITPPSPLSHENRRVAERPALEVKTDDGAGPSSRGRPTKKSAMQNQLLREVLLKNARQHLRTALPLEESAQRVVPPAGDRDRMAALTKLNRAIRAGKDARVFTACKLISMHTANTGPRLDETGLESLEKLAPWLRTSQNTSQIKSLNVLMQSTSTDEVNKVIQQFANFESQTQVSMEDRIFGAVQRLRELMRDPDAARPMTEVDAAAGLQRLDEAIRTRDFKLALACYKEVVPNDKRSEKEIERDVKDFRKLTLHWLGLKSNKSPIKSLQAMVEHTDIVRVKLVIGEFAAGNSPQDSTRQKVLSMVSTLRRFAQEAASVSLHTSSGTHSGGQGVKRQAPEEAGESSERRARRKTNPDPKEDVAASDAS